jgi:hypothetical protein
LLTRHFHSKTLMNGSCNAPAARPDPGGLAGVSDDNEQDAIGAGQIRASRISYLGLRQ